MKYMYYYTAVHVHIQFDTCTNIWLLIESIFTIISGTSILNYIIILNKV